MDLGVSDIPKAIAFYSGLFGWHIPPGPPDAGGYSVAGKDGHDTAGIGPKMGPADAPSRWTTYLASDDADATALKVTRAGGEVLTGPMDVMDFGRMAVAADPAGAVFGIWEGRRQTGAGLANAPGGLTWNEHFSRDFEKAKAFYGTVFGYEFGDMGSGSFVYATLQLGGRPVGGIGAYPPEALAEARPAWSVYFGTVSTDASVLTVTGAGGSVLREPFDSPYGRMATVSDNQGAVFNLISVPEQD